MYGSLIGRQFQRGSGRSLAGAIAGQFRLGLAAPCQAGSERNQDEAGGPAVTGETSAKRKIHERIQPLEAAADPEQNLRTANLAAAA
jgi:hypothetical protein